jgi:hypothetical protein
MKKISLTDRVKGEGRKLTSYIKSNEARVNLISGFHHEVDDICALLGYYAASCGNCPETSVNNYHTTPRNIPEERRYHEARVTEHVIPLMGFAF